MSSAPARTVRRVRFWPAMTVAAMAVVLLSLVGIAIGVSLAGHFESSDESDQHRLKVCSLEERTIITIKELDFDKEKHSKNLNECPAAL